MADEDKRGAGEESADADAARAEADPSSVVEPSNEELTAADAADEDFAADLRDDSGTDGDDPDGGADSDDRVPEPVGVGGISDGKKAASRTPRKSTDTARKDRPTPKRDGDSKAERRTGPITFTKESIAELRKVVYPTGSQLANYFIVVLIFVLFIILVVGLLDLGLGTAIFRIFS